ncbi:BMP family lipoprotein [Miniphocaeibacter halophilus]|uniref:BMP family ABC transporter substrate-binding protein n=1 Tax=Miniphocaeibacter halophilus TaxID=2931922 RepID=A0AC61MP12_9FIRM|nr:BMP family ABC transporter substrate-binding protein [Miniphocaeibacter halophilus]QQK07255.1 BMP family ABC transporter substrate-binding protein [Miniphocaeibacter halophilus]
MKKRFLICLSIIMITLLVGCSGNDKKEDKKTNEVKGNIGVIYTKAKLGGNSFNDVVQTGLKRAEKDLSITFTEVEPDTSSDQENAQETMASSGDFDLIIAVGQEQSDVVEKIAGKYPEQKFAMIDADLDLPNVASYVSKEEEASFLIGTLVALSADSVEGSNIFGFVGGVNNPLINKFLAGYESGVRYINKDNKVLADYVGGFQDPSTAKVITNTMEQKGAKVVYHAAGASGLGVFQSAKEQGILAVGVNTNQNSIDPDTIMASMLKKADESAYRCIKEVMEDDFQAGVHYLGLKENGVGYTVEDSNIETSQEIIDQVEKIKEQIISGEIIVPETLDEVSSFVNDNSYSK